MLDVLVHVARPVDVLHQIYPLWLQCPIDTLEDIERLGLIVYGVKGRDEIKGFGLRSLVEVAQIDGGKLGIVEPGSRHFLSRVGYRVLGKVHPHESAPGIERRQPGEHASSTASEVEHADALRETIS